MRDAGSGIVIIAPVHLQLVAKLALWGLSRQELLLGFLTTKAGAVLRALLPSLTVDNRWQVGVLTCNLQTAARTPCGTPWSTSGSLPLQSLSAIFQVALCQPVSQEADCGCWVWCSRSSASSTA